MKSIMRLGQFVGLCVLLTIAVGVLAFIGGSGAGAIALRMIVTMVVLQTGYFVVLAVLAVIGPQRRTDKSASSAAKARVGSEPSRQGRD